MIKIIICVVIYVIAINIYARLKKKKAIRLKQLAYHLYAELQSTFNPCMLNVILLLKISKNDFRKLDSIYYKSFNRNLVNELYEFLQPGELKILELLVSKNAFEMALKMYILKGVTTNVNDFIVYENKNIQQLVNFLSKLPDHSYEDLRFVYISLFGKDLDNEKIMKNEVLRTNLKRIF